MNSIPESGRKPYRVIDLFAGAGGMTLGFVQTGAFSVVAAVESNAHAAQTYEANFGDHVLQWDIQDLLPEYKFPGAEVVIGGPPCQGFSQLGSRDPGDDRNSLWREFLEVVDQVKPLAFVIENVPSFLKSDQFQQLKQTVRHELRSPSGGRYVLRSGVLNALDFGVPQRRRRGFVIGAVDAIGLPQGLPTGPLFGRPAPTLESAGVLDGLRDPETTELEGEPPYKGLALHVGRTPTEISRQRYRSIPEGGNRFDLPAELTPPCWRNKPTGTTDVMGRLDRRKPALTIRTEFFKPEKGRYLHPTADRPITHLEAARIQTFPDDYAWHGTKSSIAKQIGNAVPPVLAKALAKKLLMGLDAIGGSLG